MHDDQPQDQPLPSLPGSQPMAQAMPARWTAARLDEVAMALDAVPPPERAMTKAQAISRLMPTLKKMRERGHSLDSIAQHLGASGLPIASRTLARYLASAGAVKSPRRASPRRQREGQEASVSSA